MSKIQFHAACQLTREIRKIESEAKMVFPLQPPSDVDLWIEGNFPQVHNLLMLASGALVMAVTSLETQANEIHFFSSLGPRRPIIPDFDFNPIDEKYKLLLKSHERSMDWGRGSPQKIKKLIQHRNKIVHYIPDFQGGESHMKQSTEMNSNSWQRSPFFLEEDLFPRAWASYSFCKWALNSIVEFMEDLKGIYGNDSLPARVIGNYGKGLP